MTRDLISIQACHAKCRAYSFVNPFKVLDFQLAVIPRSPHFPGHVVLLLYPDFLLEAR